MSKLIVFHGLGSSCNNIKYQNLPFDSVKIDVDHNNLSWKEIYDIYNDAIQKEMGNDLILLGHSLGGWWARFFAKKYGIPVVLLNPVVTFDLVPSFNNFDDYKANEYDICSYPPVQMYYYIEQPDTVLNYSAELLQKLASEGDVSYGVGNHRMENYDKINELIEFADNNFVL